MSFGGSVGAMISSLKQNNSMLNRKKLFKDYKGRLMAESGKALSEGNLINEQLDKEVVRKVIAKIRKDYEEERIVYQRRRLILLISLFCLGVICLLILMY